MVVKRTSRVGTERVFETASVILRECYDRLERAPGNDKEAWARAELAQICRRFAERYSETLPEHRI
jgi:hypothetical protein